MTNKIKKLLKNIFINQEYIAPESEQLKGNVIIVTGDTGVIGSAIVKVLLRCGAIVIGASADSKKTEEIANYFPVKTDITQEHDIKNLIDFAEKKFSKVDVLINNAGLFSYGAIDNIDSAEFDKIVSVNIKGTFLLSKAVVPIMKSQKSGTIINIGSKISRNTQVEPKKSLYALTKYAIEGFSFALNRELKSSGVRVVCLMPGTVNTFFSRNYKNFMSPLDVAEIVKMVISMKQIDFESVVFKSKRQDI